MRGFFMRRILTFLIVLLSGGLLVACTTQPESKTDGPKLNPNGSVTTVYMVRHAQKEAGKDPALTEAGKERAKRLANLLKKENVVKVYSTDTRRTRDTAAPVARQFGLEVEIYEPMHRYRMADRFKSQPGVIVVVGHSNTIPDMAAAVEDRDEPYLDINERDYETMYWADIMPDGKVIVVERTYKDLIKRMNEFHPKK